MEILPTVTQVNYFRNRTDDDYDDEHSSIALVSIVANEPLRVSTTSGANLNNNTGTTKFTVSKVHSSESSRKIACIFTPEKEGESASHSLSESEEVRHGVYFQAVQRRQRKVIQNRWHVRDFLSDEWDEYWMASRRVPTRMLRRHALFEEEREDTAIADDVYRADDAADDGAAWFEFALIKKEDTKERARRRRRLTFATRNIFSSNRPTLSPSRLATPSPFSKILKFTIDRLESSRVGTPWNAVGER